MQQLARMPLRCRDPGGDLWIQFPLDSCFEARTLNAEGCLAAIRFRGPEAEEIELQDS